MRRSLRSAGLPALVVLLGAMASPAEAVRINEFPPPVANSAPLGIAAGPDGNMWFTEVAGSRIGRITPAGSITDWSTGSGISLNSQPWGIAAGADGNLWFTEEVGRVAKITTAASATEYSGGISPGAGPRGIAAGPDGNIWFTEAGGDRIAKVEPGPTVQEYSFGITPGSRPLSITAGSDGNLWFTSPDTNRIGRITTAGAVTEFTAGISPGARPHDITAGPDGNLWFTEADGNRVARITRTGVVTEFSAGISPGSGPRGIAAGPDGNLWFTEEQRNRIARITPSGVVTEYSAGISGTSGIAGIAAGPTGDVWYTSATTNVIGRVRLDPSAVTGPATEIGPTRAALAATITPFSSRTGYAFQYGRTTAYGSITASATVGPGVSPVAVRGALGGLKPRTVYHYRVIASSAAGTSTGRDRTFITARGLGGGTRSTRDRSAPRMRVAGRRLTLDRNGRVRVSLRCPLSEPLGCRGSVRLVAGSRATRLGARRFRIGGGQTASVAIRLSARGKRLVRPARALKARLIVSVRDAAGNRRRTAVRVTVRRGR